MIRLMTLLLFLNLTGPARAETAQLDLTDATSWREYRFNVWDDSFPVGKVVVRAPATGLTVTVQAVDGAYSPASCPLTTRLLRDDTRELTLAPQLDPEEGATCVLTIERQADGAKAVITVESIGT